MFFARCPPAPPSPDGIHDQIGLVQLEAQKTTLAFTVQGRCLSNDPSSIIAGMFLFQGQGFLGTRAPFISDVSLLLMLLTAALFTVGWRLAVRQRYELHRRVQTISVVLNTIVVGVVMVTSYVIFILPGIPDKLDEGSYGITTIHALLGLASVILGVYLTLGGNGLLPQRLRYTNYKLWMRTSYLLYMLATLLGVLLYVIVFVYGI